MDAYLIHSVRKTSRMEQRPQSDLFKQTQSIHTLILLTTRSQWETFLSKGLNSNMGEGNKRNSPDSGLMIKGIEPSDGP
jgi:hypothetical protein